ncbi:MAG: ATP-binding protein [Clostridiales bacterium]|uniref:Lon protease family protein n=1 Tax=Terrisporobacter sp. TaxID=1965305 RepID=UPI002A3EE80F|nr:ATP-binding protein [Terrisporobacter sp.]MCI5629236.1 AAA family ATPase [Clostridium sp.]MDD5878024.1 ATP-binding protein [Clostridiales bacterium]MCI6457841.1 AAA family ATPase [Clostridium sp.]MDD7757483.1 ATP-binding protein [Clostridiales bacterium]MDY4137107.1 ATP-binding protein [Terrisporobacter sp.]
MQKFNNTSEIEPLKDFLGQDRAMTAMEFGLKIDNPSYNIYVAGEPGTGKTTYTMKVLETYANNKENHKDWCYVYNFDNPREPIVISLQRGEGKVFKDDIEKMIDKLFEEIKEAFDSEEYEINKNTLLEEYEIQKEDLVKKIKVYGEEKGFKLKSSKVGMVFVPLNENFEEEVSSDEFFKIKKELENMAIKVVYQIREIEEKIKTIMIEIEDEVGKIVVDPHIENLKEKYKSNEKVLNYIEKVREDILKNLELFYLDDEELREYYSKDCFLKYVVNLFVDNQNNDKAPIIVESNPSPSNLFGKVEYDYNSGNIKTDFTKIFSGSVQKANGGYLVLYAQQLLSYPLSWELLKRTIKSQKIPIETKVSIEAEEIPLDLKIILIGSNYIYDALYRYDNEFSKYFKIFVDFENEMDKSEITEYGIAQFIASQCEKNKFKHFTYEAVEDILKHSTRLVGCKNKLSTDFNKLLEIITEADIFAKIENKEFVEKKHVKKAIYEKHKRLSKIENKMDEYIQNNTIMIDTEGSRVGVINGLSVLSMGEYSFGRPSRITVTTSMGNRGLVNIEREVKMSGPIHNKSVLILQGYLTEHFAQEYSLSINAYICFEQNYGGIEGDSATLAELCALLSSLSNVPIKQNIAVTGSLNQKGDIQVVGGITEKIEGFYNVCKKRGLDNKTYGVILPKDNMDNLILNDEMEESIKNGNFKIYPVTNVEESVEILMDKMFKDVEILVKEKLDKYNESKEVKKN